MEKILPSLNSILNKKISEIPKHILANSIKKKLKEQGVSSNRKKISLALAEHILEGNNEQFIWEEGDNKELENIDLDFNQDELDSIFESVKQVTEEIPDIVKGTVQGSIKDAYLNLKNEWPEYDIWQESETFRFKGNLKLRWGKGINFLKMLLHVNRELGQERADALTRSKAKKNIVKREVLILIHMRACQVFTEIITLLENGLADGAMTRWRTLYELSIVVELIAKYGDEMANRYVDHQHVSAMKELKNQFSNNPEFLEEEFAREDLNLAEQNLTEVIEKYGKEFGTDYGWAAFNLGMKNPRFKHLEEAAGRVMLPHEYKLASYKVHAGIVGVTWNIGQMLDNDVPLTGFSNAGLDTPANHAAHTLVHICGAIIGNSRKIEDQITLGVMIKLRDNTVKTFSKAAVKLKRDELRVNGATGEEQNIRLQVLG